jgi:hypothetical protein
MFASHPSSALEYWFFKVNAGPISLLVDWIERRKLNEHVMRASIHSPYKREVIFKKLDSFMPGDNFLSTQQSVGHASNVSWELNIDPGQEWIKPDIFPAGLLRMTDLILVSAPLARFTGWIRHGSQQISLNNVPGLLSNYWGRQLASEWWWISAHQFDQEGTTVECTVLRTSLWGTPVQLPFAYLYLQQPDRKDLLLAPFNPVRVAGSPEKFQIQFNRIGREKITLIGTGREYGDFGDRIMNTLTGDLEIREGKRVIACANGTAGLERRAPATILSIATSG